MKVSFEKSVPGRRAMRMPAVGAPVASPEDILGAGLLRAEPARLPEMGELDLVRHFTALSRQNHGIDNSFYPLGSCTMKYNPKINEQIARYDGFAQLHPLSAEADCQGTLELMYRLERGLAMIGGMAECTLAPTAGAHGELIGMMLVRAYHAERDGPDGPRTQVLVPDSAHGTNPASAALCGYEVVNIPSGPDGEVDLKALEAAMGPNVASLMLTNPNTLGLFERRIEAIAELVHRHGALLYYDGANLNAIMGKCRPGDMGFDLMHLNLHKTFSTPHGGGGPGSGPVGVTEALRPYLPVPYVAPASSPPEGEPDAGAATGDVRYTLSWDRPQSIGRITGFYGNTGMLVRAYAYLRAYGEEGLRSVSEHAVLNANYLMARLHDNFPPKFDRTCMHEFVTTGEPLLPFGARAMDLAKRLIDYGFHPPTVYFPLIVKEAIMIEPTETESPETLDAFAEACAAILAEARENPEKLHEAPQTTPVRRLDETRAVRQPDLCWRGETPSGDSP